MGLFSLFGKKKAESPVKEEKPTNPEEFDVYSGMRVEVTTDMGKVLFVAKLLRLRGNRGELHQYTEFEPDPDMEPTRVNIRGYSDHERKAVYMMGVIAPGPKHIWQVEELNVVRIGNDRAFFRLDTQIDATVTMFSGLEMGEKPCKMLNISVGGAYIESDRPYYEGDKFLLKFKLLDDRPMSTMYCQVMRVIEKEDAGFGYGCQFLELTEEDQNAITQNIFSVQRQKRAGIK